MGPEEQSQPHSFSKTWQEYSAGSLACLFLLYFPALTPLLLVLEALIDICEHTTKINTEIPQGSGGAGKNL